MKISLSDFDLDPKVHEIFSSLSWSQDKELLLNLERYKFVSRQDLIHKLQSQGVLARSVQPFQKSSLDSLTLSRIEKEEAAQEVIIDYRTNFCTVYAHPFSNLSVERIKMMLSVSSVEVVHVTPSNFYELCGTDIQDWDYTVMLKRIVLDCMEKKGTDIHFSAVYQGAPIYPIKYRIGNDVIPIDLFKLDQKANKALILILVQNMTNANPSDIGLPDGVTTSVMDLFGDGDVSLRVTANTVSQGYKCVCRITTAKTANMDIDELGFGEGVSADLRTISMKRTGLTPVTGAMRTGKNTTIFSIAKAMVDEPISIIEFSSPLEFKMPFDQVDYKNDVSHLKSLISLSKKQDLDVAIVGEIPNSDVGYSVLDLVLSSVHVLTSFHLNRVWHLPHKFHEFYGIHYKNVFSLLNGCFTQKMYVEQCPYCDKVPHAVSEHPNQFRREILLSHGVETYPRAMGCEICNHTATSSRLRPLMERFIMTSPLYSSLMEVKEPYEMEKLLMNYVKSSGNDFETSLCSAISQGIIHIESLDSLI